ncbi:hypothetical protein QTL95_18775 [Rhizobium sp. S152]|uniref:hypothetical protein n=1 Tax=Rhizobium sp. S152 TaxID=3055038 RepID=UPI0025A9BB5E|nr:hypothetical protein [Rhizobium sp. S152]MDM9627941.1 hypothetical protein [Rhizobium sp. S152]
MQRGLDKLEQWLVRIICAVALLFVGFAHQVPALASDPTDPAHYAAYTLPDGTLPSLCITLKDDDGKATPDHKASGQGCEACRIGAAVLLPTPTDIIGTAVSFLAQAAPARGTEAFRRQIYPPNTGPRAPPADPIIS